MERLTIPPAQDSVLPPGLHELWNDLPPLDVRAGRKPLASDVSEDIPPPIPSTA